MSRASWPSIYVTVEYKKRIGVSIQALVLAIWLSCKSHQTTQLSPNKRSSCLTVLQFWASEWKTSKFTTHNYACWWWRLFSLTEFSSDSTVWIWNSHHSLHLVSVLHKFCIVLVAFNSNSSVSAMTPAKRFIPLNPHWFCDAHLHNRRCGWSGQYVNLINI